MVLVELLLILVLRAQNEEIRIENHKIFSNPINQRENRQTHDRDGFIKPNLDLKGDNLQESDNHANIEANKQNNMTSGFFCEIPCDSSSTIVENNPSSSSYGPKSDQKLLYQKIESSLDSTPFEVPKPTILTTVSSIVPGCQCLSICLCIKNKKQDKNTLDIDSACRIGPNILSSDISLSNKQNQQDSITNKEITKSETCKNECEIKEDFNSTEQCLEQEIYPDIIENIQSSKLTQNITLPSHIRCNPENPEQIKEVYYNFENEMKATPRVQTDLKAEKEEIQNTVQPSTSQEILISGVKNAKKRKYSDESNEIDESKTVNDSKGKKSFACFHSEGSNTCSNASENEQKVNQNKIIYDPESQETLKELEYHLKNCDYYTHSEIKRSIIEIIYTHSMLNKVIYVRMQTDQNIPKTEKSNQKLHIFGTFKNKPSNGGSTFTVRVPKFFEDEAQFKRSNNPLASAFVPITTDEYNLTLTLTRIHLKHKFPSALFKLDNETVYFPTFFYAYHFKQVIIFEINRRLNNSVYYFFKYIPEKEVTDINS